MLALAVAALAKHKCSAHDERAQCHLFRHQHGCAWDQSRGVCTALTPCEQRGEAACEFELTTGGVAWDSTRNMCFYDTTRHACRHSDECFGLDAAPCKAAGCVMAMLIERSTPIADKKRQAFTPNADKQPGVPFQVSAVERDMAKTGRTTTSIYL